MEGWIKLHRKLQEKALWQCTTPEQKVILLGVNGSFTEYLKTREDERSNEGENKAGDECENFYERYYRECDQS